MTDVYHIKGIVPENHLSAGKLGCWTLGKQALLINCIHIKFEAKKWLQFPSGKQTGMTYVNGYSYEYWILAKKSTTQQ